MVLLLLCEAHEKVTSEILLKVVSRGTDEARVCQE